MDILSLLYNNFSIYSPALLVISYIGYYMLSNSLFIIVLLLIGIFIGFYLNNILKEKLNYISKLF
jgi:F0F1-type ATP synthase assembly protein I|tara:strand:+ start:142 stop:336 length:195 start_codon:yes stop_codon:yes gene_type:complete